MRGRTLRVEASKPVEVSDADAEGNWVRPGCFYVIRGNGNRELVGRGAFAPDVLLEPILFPDLLFQVDLHDAVDPTFFWCLWCSAYVRHELAERARTAAGIYKINTANLTSLPLRVPPIGEQRLIAAGLSRRLEATDSLVARCVDEQGTINTLASALLRAAFAGDA